MSLARSVVALVALASLLNVGSAVRIVPVSGPTLPSVAPSSSACSIAGGVWAMAPPPMKGHGGAPVQPGLNATFGADESVTVSGGGECVVLFVGTYSVSALNDTGTPAPALVQAITHSLTHLLNLVFEVSVDFTKCRSASPSCPKCVLPPSAKLLWAFDGDCNHSAVVLPPPSTAGSHGPNNSSLPPPPPNNGSFPPPPHNGSLPPPPNNGSLPLPPHGPSSGAGPQPQSGGRQPPSGSGRGSNGPSGGKDQHPPKASSGGPQPEGGQSRDSGQEQRPPPIFHLVRHH